MAEVSVSILTVEKENAINTFYNLETSKIDYFQETAICIFYKKECIS